MYNGKLVLSYTIMLGVQIVLVGVFAFLFWGNQSIDLPTFLLSWTSIVVIIDTIFFVLVMIYQWEQLRYKVLGVTSILVSITFLGIIQRYFTDGFLMTTFSDINLFSAAVFLFITGYILVDDTTYPFVKGILSVNLILLLLFRTPLFFAALFTIHGFFQSTDSIFVIVFATMFSVHMIVSVILGVMKIKMMNRIDFI